ncbi:glucose-6-phosphate dehydrogenase assembly protein OpcA [Flexivirga meconopsidis]|uniref:glucose-6-phosphate dehydrogenase assembly protein OpcA n=1 Tax=Flexivirga meconopsidis TaxID=2977121 RepID=UPI0022400555
MIVDLPSTTTKDVSKQLVRLRDESGAVALGRVMTLIIVTDEEGADDALEAATHASRQHPSRIIAVVTGNPRGKSRMDAQVRVGGEAGVSEIVILRLHGELSKHGASVVTPLLAADTPVVAWWPGAANDVASSPIGKLASRRITDASLAKDPRKALARRRADYAPGDTDMAWSRSTRWRGLLATALDLPPYEPVTSVTVTGASDSASSDLVAGWLAVRLKCPVRRARSRPGTGLVSVRMERASGPIDLVRPDRRTATLSQPGQPIRRLDLTRPGTAESLAEELGRLGEDDLYREALVRGLPMVSNVSVTASKAVASGAAPSPQKAARAARKRTTDGPDLTVKQLEEMPLPKGAPAESHRRKAKKAAAKAAATRKAAAKKAPAKKSAGKKATAKKSTR